MRNAIRFISALTALILCAALAPAALATYTVAVPDSAQTYFSDRVAQGYTFTAWNDDERYTHAYAVLSKDRDNRLFVLKKNGDSYRIELSTNTALYAGDRMPQIISYNDNAFSVAYFLSGGGSDVFDYYQGDDGIWRLHQYDLILEDGGRRRFHTLYDDRMVYKYFPPGAGEPSVIRNIYGVYQRALRYLSVGTLPRTLAQARETLSLPPQIPAGDFDAVNVKFRSGEKFEVYSAPDDAGLRAANGKAVVSTNDWIQVFGTEAGWMLIQYDISSDKMRFGYITQTALPGTTASVPELAFIPQPVEVLRNTAVTDDPLHSQEAFETLQKGQADCWYLATFNTEYVYVQATTNGGQPYRGFVEKSAVRIVPPEDMK